MQPIHWSVVALFSANCAVGLRIPSAPQVTEMATVPPIQPTSATVIQQRDCFTLDPEIFGDTADCVTLPGQAIGHIPIPTQDIKLARDAAVATSTVQSLPQCTSIRLSRDNPRDEITFTCSGCDGFPTDEIIDFVLADL